MMLRILVMALMILPGGVTAADDQIPARAMFALIIGVFLGGRLGYVFFYQPSLLWDVTAAFPFWGVLKINEGGLSHFLVRSSAILRDNKYISRST